MTDLITGMVIGIIVIALLYLWLLKHFASMSEEEKEIYEGNKTPYQCPYDIERRSCKDMNCPDGYINCKDCDWYDNGVRPSVFDKRNKCPFDSDHCGVIGRALQKEFPTKICRECPRYYNFLKKKP